MGTLYPLRQPNVQVTETGSEIVLCRDCDDVIHVLNPVARLIWECCDGEHTLGDIEWEIRQAYTVPGVADVARDVRQTVDLLVAKGLLA